MRVLLTAALAAAALAAGSAVALANGDPASHVLPTEEVFLPSDPGLCTLPARRLDALTEQTANAGYLVKVAVIGTPEDLGDVPELFGRAAEYARFLGRELDPGLARGTKRDPYRLLVVMRTGFGLYRGSAKESRAIQRLGPIEGDSDDGLTRAAYRGVMALVRSSGTRIETPRPEPRCEGGGSSSSSSSSLLMFIAPIVLVGLALVAAKLGRR